MIDDSYGLSISKQCDLLGLSRSNYYYEPRPQSEFNLKLMRLIDEQYLKTPAYGSRLMTAHFKRQGFDINRKRTSRLMKIMGIEGMFQKPKKDAWTNKIERYPYLLKNLEITSQNHVWGTDITYIPVESGYLYLVAVVDLYSRFVLSWELSNSLELEFCLEALVNAFDYGVPKILNSDQGVQFTSHDYTKLLKSKGINISMAGTGRCYDNILVERFWRTLKYEEVYLNQYMDSKEAYDGISSYLEMYNNERPHSSLNYKTPSEVYRIA